MPRLTCLSCEERSKLRRGALPLLAAVCDGVTICVTTVTLLRLKAKDKPSNWMLPPIVLIQVRDRRGFHSATKQVNSH
jgi:hypothetical protein